MLAKGFLVLISCVVAVTTEFACEGDGNYPDPEDVSKYYVCSDGRVSIMECPEGQLYSTDYGTCEDENSRQPGTGSRTIKAATPESSNYKVVCYLPNWVDFSPDKDLATLCTHINYAFGVLDETTLTLKLEDPESDKAKIKNLLKLKKANPKLKVMISLGGWSDSEGSKYSQLASSSKSRKKFNKDVVQFLEQNGLDGLDLDWEYPACPQGECGGNEKDKKNFAKWIQELRKIFDSHSPRYQLTAAVSSSSYYVEKGYDVPALASALDFINVMAYDYSGSKDKTTGQNAPFKAGPGMDPDNTVESSMKYWENQGAPPGKLVLGMPAYGVSFTLKDTKKHGFGAPTKGPGKPGPSSDTPGELAYYETCQLIQDGWKKVTDPNAGPYAYSGDQWVGYDDPATVAKKTKFIQDMGYGGAMVWAITQDDFKGQCCGVKFPLLKSINNVFMGKSSGTSKCK